MNTPKNARLAQRPVSPSGSLRAGLERLPHGSMRILMMMMIVSAAVAYFKVDLRAYAFLCFALFSMKILGLRELRLGSWLKLRWDKEF